MRAAIEENPLGKLKKPKSEPKDLDTTEQETGKRSEKTMPEQEPVPMEAFDGAAKDGIGLDAAALAMEQNADVENRNG